MTYLLDTSCLVAAVSPWHEHHQATRDDLTRRRERRETAVMAGPCVVEAYAVLTRLPPPHRLDGATVRTLLEGNWGDADIVAPAKSDWWNVVSRAPERGIAGGQIYDAVIAACARHGRVSTIVTWNLAHFALVAGDLEVVTPDGQRAARDGPRSV